MIESIETHIAQQLGRSGQARRIKPGTPIMNVWWAMRGTPAPADLELAEGLSVQGRISASEWIADCCFCPNAMPIALSDPRWVCSHSRCQNGGLSGADGKAIRVELPDCQTIMRIEALLLLRPKPLTRGWAPGESIERLVEENRENNIGLEKLDRARQLLQQRWASIFGEEQTALALSRGALDP